MKKRKIWIGVLLCSLCLASCGNSGKESGKENTTENTEKADVDPGTEADRKNSKQADAQQSEEKSYEEIISDEEIKDFGSVVIVGDAAYELFTYREEVADSYATVVNQLGEALPEVSVYDMIVPLGSGVIFPDNLKDQIQSTDQREAMQSIFAKLNDSVQAVDVYPDLMEHRKEYIYFRTDHHWTALGAYYAYETFCKEKGMEPLDLNELEKKEFQGFLGSFYKDTDQDKALEKNPDVITAYVPKSNATLEVKASDGTIYNWNIINDVTDYGAGLKYSTFVAGDNPISTITNQDITDGSSCVVVKESFGNALIPFLVDHYQKIYIIDYRYWTGSLIDLAKEKKVDDVIFINNLSMIRNQYLVGQLQAIVK